MIDFLAGDAQWWEEKDIGAPSPAERERLEDERHRCRFQADYQPPTVEQELREHPDAVRVLGAVAVEHALIAAGFRRE